jgi:hypothetical protein
VPKLLEFPPCGQIRFQDMGTQLRVELHGLRIHWDVWNEAEVERAIGVLRQWRRKVRRERRQGGSPERRPVGRKRSAAEV